MVEIPRCINHKERPVYAYTKGLCRQCYRASRKKKTMESNKRYIENNPEKAKASSQRSRDDIKAYRIKERKHPWKHSQD